MILSLVSRKLLLNILTYFKDIDSSELDDINDESLSENKCFQQLETQKSFDQEKNQLNELVRDIREVAEALLVDSTTLDAGTKKMIKDLENEINNSQMGWKKLTIESNLFVLSTLLYDWLELLKTPILNRDDLEIIVINYKQPDVCLSKLNTVSICIPFTYTCYITIVFRKQLI